MKIIQYENRYAEDFKRLNVSWIKKYFNDIESADLEIFDHIEQWLEKGSMIYFAVENDIVYATCMIIPLDGEVWEICKLAADDRYKGKGAGNAVFQACTDYAIKKGAKKITLISNHILKPALHIYEKNGFQKTDLRFNDFARGDVQYDLDISRKENTLQ